MPRAGWVKPATDQRLSDHISIGVLTRVFPPELVDAVVAEAGRGERRSRLLPARVVVYYVLAMALFSDASYEEVMRQLVEGLVVDVGVAAGLGGADEGGDLQGASAAGSGAVGVVVRRGLSAVGGQAHARRVLSRAAADESRRDDVWMSLTRPENEAAFGRPGSARGHGRQRVPAGAAGRAGGVRHARDHERRAGALHDQ